MHVDTKRTELESLETPLLIQRIHFIPCQRCVGGGVHARVHLHPVPHMTAQQHVHRHTERFGGDVPQTMVNGGDCCQPQRAGWKTCLLHQVVDQKLDAAWVLAPEKGDQVIEQRKQGFVRPVVVALTPAGDAFVCVHRQNDAGAIFVARHEHA